LNADTVIVGGGVAGWASAGAEAASTSAPAVRAIVVSREVMIPRRKGRPEPSFASRFSLLQATGFGTKP
jgi:glycine/D-amino acid oxidase-like deaminating enzyme